MPIARRVRTMAFVLALLGVVAMTTDAQAAMIKPFNTRSGLPWASGAFMPGDDPYSHEVFGYWRGAHTDVALTYAGRRSWEDITYPMHLEAWRGAPQTLVLSMAPWPEGQGHTLTRCAAGEYDPYWTQFGQNVQGAGMAGRMIIRLAWEFTGGWVEWAARNPAEFAACWRRIVTAAEHFAPALRWELIGNRGASPLLIDPKAAYPGDAYVDIIGVDSYDGYPPVKDEASWQTQYAGTQGLKYYADWARSRGKRFSVPEWGLYPGTAWGGNGGGDNAFYIRKMFAFFRQQADIMAYESYFNEHDPYQGGALQLNPRGGTEYRRQVAAMRLAQGVMTRVRP